MKAREELPQRNRASKKIHGKSVVPGFRLTLGITIAMLSLLIIIPLCSVLGYSFTLSPAEFLEVITTKTTAQSFATTIGCAAIAALVNVFFGVAIAWVLTRYEFPLKRLVDGLIELPFAMPTAVAGITLSKMYADNGEIGSFFAQFGIQVSYTRLGIVVALVFVGIPFVVRAVQPVLQGLDPSYEEAAHILGANRTHTFFKVILPELMPAILTGFGLALARGIGEFGSVIYISGNSAREGTQVVSYVIMQKLDAGTTSYNDAAAIALVLLIISFALLFIINAIQLHAAKRVSGEASTASSGKSAPQSIEQGSKGLKVLLMVLALGFILVMLVAPLISIITRSLGLGFGYYLESITTSYALSALRVTLLATIVAVLVNTLFGLVASWALTKFRFRGQRLLTTLIDIPFSISPVIAGLAFVLTFGRRGWAYPIIQAFNAATGLDIQLVFSIPGVVLATIFVTFPFVVRELLPVMHAQGSDEEEAAALMGAGGLKIFHEITMPKIRWALLYGIVLCAARAFGEFGAVYALSKTRGETFTLPLEIDALYNAGTPDSITAAFAVSSILVILAIVLLVIRNILEYRTGKRGSR
ncbi:MAG: sulfate ABC transporter permease subunit CysT [Coriobacteriales bacterium]|jgi:sulfate ABC transporter permease protein CysT/sulfate ABC transporter permease protein CysW